MRNGISTSQGEAQLTSRSSTAVALFDTLPDELIIKIFSSIAQHDFGSLAFTALDKRTHALL